jgi:hypothetical protein
VTQFTTTEASQINKLAEEFTAGPQVIDTEAPAPTTVLLPAGFINPDSSLVKTAEIRELNGLDEEAIAKSGSTAKALQTILERGLVSIGDRNATREDLNVLLAGDRDAILLGIRKITFGKTAEFEAFCSGCNDVRNFEVDLESDVQVKELNNPISDRDLIIKLKSGIARVVLPNGVTQRKVMENANKTVAELNTLILSGCVTSINESPVTPLSVLELGIQDRETLIKEIIEHNPGPRLGEVSKVCEACGKEVDLPLSLAALFRL